MRHLGFALVVVVCSLSIAVAAPKKKAPKGGGAAQAPAGAPAGPRPFPKRRDIDPKTQAELTKLEAEHTQAAMALKHFAAKRIAKKLYDLQVKASGPDSLEADGRLATLASDEGQAGDYVNAEKHFKQHLAFTEKQYGVDSQMVMYSLWVGASVYGMQNRFEEMENIYKRMMKIAEKLGGKKSRDFVTALTQLGSHYMQRNIYTAAQKTFEDALALSEQMAKSPDDQELVGPIEMVAMIDLQMNQQQKAIALFDRTIKIVEKSNDMMFIMRVSTLWSIAMQYAYGGRKDLAGPLFKKAIAMSESEIARLEKTAPNDPQIQSLYSQLGFQYRYTEEYAKAEQAFTKADQLAKKAGNPMPDVSIAEIKRILGKPKDALAIYEAAKAYYAKTMPSLAPSMNASIIEVLKELKDYGRAEKLYQEYLGYTSGQFGKKSIMYAYGRLTGVNIYAPAGKLKEAEAALDDTMDLFERDLANVMRSGTETDHAVYFSKNSYVLDTAINYNLSYAPRSGNATRIALTTLLRRKGRVLDAAAASLSNIRKKLSPDDKKMLDELSSARAQLARLTVAGPEGASDPDFAKEVAALEDKVARLEIALGKKSAAFRTVTQTIELAPIQKLIPSDARLIEFVNYQPYDPNMSYADAVSQKFKPRRYAAYVVGTTGDPSVVDLGDAVAIESAVEKFRKAVADPDNDQAADLGRALFDLTMAKVIPKLGNATNILVAPDGALNVVPFSALVDGKKQFLIAKYSFTYLTSGRDLLRLSAKTKAKGGGIMFADPQFDATGKTTKAGDDTTRGARSIDLASLHWPQLPGTAAEADAVTKAFKKFKVYRGADATEGELKKVKGPEVLHLATHGFFLPDEKPPAEDAGGAGGGVAMMAPAGAPMGAAPVAKSQIKYENPLLRSGIALAGANKLQSGDDDGLLTALEASDLDLEGTKLVVLSACETGVGKVTNGDGVYGLRRSLVIAGAQSLVMSLWQVDDFATKELMSGFYKGLTEGKARNAALRDTQIKLLSNPKYSHPFYWAAFVGAGSTSALKD